MSNFKVLSSYVSSKGEVVFIEMEQSNDTELNMYRIQQSHNKYKFTIEDENGEDIDITDIVSDKIKSAFATIYHEQYNLKNL